MIARSTWRTLRQISQGLRLVFFRQREVESLSPIPSVCCINFTRHICGHGTIGQCLAVDRVVPGRLGLGLSNVIYTKVDRHETSLWSTSSLNIIHKILLKSSHAHEHPRLYSSQTMSRIEELPADFDESLNLNASPSAPPQNSGPSSAAPISSTPFPISTRARDQHGSTPTPPPHMESVRSHTADEIVQMMNQTPLFMNSLENADPEGEFAS